MDIDKTQIIEWFRATETGILQNIIKCKKDIDDINITGDWIVNDVKHKNVTGLIISAYKGTKDVVRWFVENDANVNLFTQSGWHPIHFAAGKGHVSTVDILCNAGAQVDVKTNTGETPIYFALRGNMRDTVRKLIHHGATIDNIDENVLQKAVNRGILPPDMLPELQSRRRGTGDRGGHHSAYDVDLAKRKQTALRQLGDDCELAKAARRMSREESPSRRLGQIQKLQDFLIVPDILELQRSQDALVDLLELCASETNVSRLFVQACADTVAKAALLWWDADKQVNHIIRLIKRSRDPKKEVYRGAMLTVLSALLKNGNVQLINVLYSEAQNIMEDLFYMVETLDNIDNVLLLIDVIIKFGHLFPKQLSHHFTGVIDILVGWCLDQTENRTFEKIGEQLSQFRTFWIEHSSFTIDLMTNLIEDADSSAKQAEWSSKSDDSSLLNCYIFVFVNILKSLVPPENDSDAIITQKIAADFIYKLTDISDSYRRWNVNERLLELFNRALLLLLSSEVNFTHSSLNKVKVHVTSLVHSNKPSVVVVCPSLPLLDSILSLVLVLLDQLDTNSVPDLLYRLFDPFSILHSAKLSQSTAVIDKVVSIITKLVEVRATAILDALYQILLSDLEICLRTLVQACASSYQVALVQQNAFAEKQYSVAEAESLALFNILVINIFASTGCTTELWELEPPVFHLYVKYLPLTDREVMKAFPRLYLGLLTSFVRLCSIHGYFSSPDNKSDDNRLTMLNVTCRLVTITDLSLDSYSTLLTLLDNAVKFLPSTTSTSSHVEVGLVLEALCKLLSRCHTLCVQKNTAILITKILRISKTVWTLDLYTKLASVSFGLLSHTDLDLVTELVNLLTCIPLEIYVSIYRKSSMNKSLLRQEKHLLAVQWTIMRKLMTEPPSPHFESNNMRSVFSYLVYGRVPHTGTWLQRLLQICIRIPVEGGTSQKSYLSIADETECPMWFWGIWNTACHCISNKLKIEPWFKPQDTFLSIEETLKEIISTLTPIKPSGKAPCFSLLPWNNQLKQVSVLLLFLDCLEKQMYNAYEGSAVSISVPQKPVKTFFRTNRGTCQEWINRNRMMIMFIAQESNEPAVVVRHGMALLQETDGRYADQEEILAFLGRALRRLGNADCIMGLYEWAKAKFGPRYEWMKALALVTNGHIEEAISLFVGHIEQNIRPLESNNSRDSEPKREIEILSKVSNPNVSIKLSCQTILDCYMKIGDYDEMLKWKDKLASLSQASSSSNVDSSAFHVDTDWKRIAYIAKLHKWDEKPDPIVTKKGDESLRWTTSVMAENLENTLLDLATHDVTNIGNVIDDAHQVTLDLVRAMSVPWSSSLSLESYAVLQKLDLIENGTQPDRQCKSPPGEYGLIGIGLLRYQELLEKMDESREVLPIRCALPCIKWSRKHKNSRLAQSLLLGELHKVGVTVIDSGDNGGSVGRGLLIAVKSLRQTKFPLEPLIHLEVEREAAKVLWSGKRRDTAVHLLTDSLLDSILTETGDPVLHATKCELNTKSMLTLFKWLQTDDSLARSLCTFIQQQASFPPSSPDHTSTGDAIECGARNLSFLSDLTEIPWIHGVPLVPPSCGPRSLAAQTRLANVDPDTLTGSLLMLSSRLSAQRTRSWYSLAGWCFQRGHHNIQLTLNSSLPLTPEERECVVQILPIGVTDQELANVTGLLGRIRVMSPGGVKEDQEDEVSSVGRVDGEQEVEEMQRQLLTACHRLSGHPDESGLLSRLVEVWRKVLSRQYNLYLSAARAYFTFLSVNTQSDTTEAMEYNITATLRLLRLLVKHSVELRDVVIRGIPGTPTYAWAGIIPQLLARLNHSEPCVRQCMVDLLCRLSAHTDTAHLVVFPALVGVADRGERKVHQEDPVSTTSRTASRLNTYRDQDEVEDLSLETGVEDCEEELLDQPGPPGTGGVGMDTITMETSSVRACLMEVTEALSRTSPQLVAEMRGFVDEMGRITVLWDELWLGTLQQNLDDIHRKISQLESEIRKTQANQNLTEEEREMVIAAKHEALLRPTVYTLEKLTFITTATPETPHETWFQETFAQLIKDTLECLQAPADPSKPQTCWQSIRHLYQFLHQRSQKHFSSGLSLADISPKLASLDSDFLPMPGLDGVVRVQNLQDSVQILPTKTKPKKLIFVGNNGKRYPYLFKGLEDLHLDERIMQFLSIVNHMFSRLNHTECPRFLARNYSVIPLGPRSGLIQMVERSTPLFTLYKKWQQRQIANAAIATTPGPVSRGAQATPAPPTTVPTHVPRPSEVFFAKLKPALEARGIRFNPEDKKDLENRKDWPQTVLKEVLNELIRDTPADLLSKELWCASLNSQDWWGISTTFSRSSAVMSMIGYIIGLGDRHLDNVMVDLNTGEIVHIDYNICFEKGRHLRVPEKVPFRLTQIIEHALGVGGIDGIFRLSCQRALERMRQGREVLLTLLEAFVYDPLVDWTPGNEGGYAGAHYGGRSRVNKHSAPRYCITRRELELEINWKFLGVRVIEMRTPWQANEKALTAALTEVYDIIAGIRRSQESQKDCKQKATLYNQIIEYLKMSDNSSQLETVLDRCQTFIDSDNTREQSIRALVSKQQELSIQTRNHQTAFDNVLGDHLPSIVNRLKLSRVDISNLQDPMKLFLDNAGQTQIIQECEEKLVELKSCIQNRRDCLSKCLDLLNSYRTVVSFYDHRYVEQGRCAHLSQLLQSIMVQTITQDTALTTLQEYTKEFVDSPISSVQQSSALALEDTLKATVNDLRNQISLKLSERGGLVAPNIKSSDVISQLFSVTRDTSLPFIECYKVFLLQYIHDRGKDFLVIDDHLFQESNASPGQFLDELCYLASVTNDMASIIQHTPLSCTEGDPYQSIQVLTSISTTFSSLKSLRNSFYNNLLPECIRTFSSNQHSTHDMMVQLGRIVRESKPILTLFEGRSEEPYDDLKRVADRLRIELSDLVQDHPLFKNYYNRLLPTMKELEQVVNIFGNLFLPRIWYYVDAVSIAASRLSACWNRVDDLLVDAIYFRGISAILNTFQLAQQSAKTFQDPSSLPLEAYLPGTSAGAPVDDLLHFVCQRVLGGVPALVLGHLFCVLLEDGRLHLHGLVSDSNIFDTELTLLGSHLIQTYLEVRNMDMVAAGMDPSRFYSQITILTNAYASSKNQEKLLSEVDDNVTLLQVSLQLTQRSLASFQWLHERALEHETIIRVLESPSRVSLLHELCRHTSELSSFTARLEGVSSSLSRLEASIEQRLRWAQGANPGSVGELLTELETRVARKLQITEEDGALAGQVFDLAESLVHLESMRNCSSNSDELDNCIETLLKTCARTTAATEEAKLQVTDLEVELVQVKTQLAVSSTHDWPSLLQQRLDQELDLLSASQLEQSAMIQERLVGLEESGGRLRGALSSHSRLIVEVKSLLRTLSKLEENKVGETAPVRAYMANYRRFSEAINSLVRFACTDRGVEEPSWTLVDQLYTACELLRDPLLVGVYQGLGRMCGGRGLNSVASPATNKNNNNVDIPSTSDTASQRKLTDSKVNKQDKHKVGSSTIEANTRAVAVGPSAAATSTVVPGKNTYAVNVWRCIRNKLSGKENSTSGGVLSVAEQVDLVIKEASDLDQLSLMYEGWTAWV